MDYYELLGLSKNFTEQELAKRYRILAKDFHPDRNPGDKIAEEKFKEVQTAYETLSNPQKRSNYDFSLTKKTDSNSFYQQGQNTTYNYESVFKNGRNYSSQKKGKDFHFSIELDLKEVCKSNKKKVVVPLKSICQLCEGKGFTEYKACEKCFGSGRMFVKKHPFNISAPCEQCNASGRSDVKSCHNCAGEGNIQTGEKIVDIDLPVGVYHGMQLRLQGYGEPLVDGISGDAIFHVNIKDHKIFVRDGKNILLEIPISYGELVLGTNIVVPCVDGKKVNITIPKGTQFDSQFRVKRMGLPDLTGARGDMYVVLKMKVPENPSGDYVNLMKKLIELDSKQVDRSFLNDF